MSSESASARIAQLVGHLTAAGSAGSGAAAAGGVSIVSRSNGVAVILIDNPPVNSLHPRVQEGLKQCYEDAVNDASIKAVVITGKGASFMAGADVRGHRRITHADGIVALRTIKFSSSPAFLWPHACSLYLCLPACSVRRSKTLPRCRTLPA
jgi:1,4-dihydroxy-2-naphthoyl-CoA synthase